MTYIVVPFERKWLVFNTSRGIAVSGLEMREAKTLANTLNDALRRDVNQGGEIATECGLVRRMFDAARACLQR